MKLLVTGSAGHLGQGLVRTLRTQKHDVFGLDIMPSDETDFVGSITDTSFLQKVFDSMVSIDYIIHTATLHKPHVATHSKAEFVATNITGTLNLLNLCVENTVSGFIFTSTTSTFGNAMNPSKSEKAVWVSESLSPIPKNIYGVTKIAAEDLCQLFYQDYQLPCLVLKTSRFFLEGDDMKHTMPEYSEDNIKANEYLFRRVDLEDVISAHIQALKHIQKIGFDKFIISASSPFTHHDCEQLFTQAPEVVAKYYPDFLKIYNKVGWKFFPSVGRVYDNSHARNVLGWEPKYTFSHVLQCIKLGKPIYSPLMLAIGDKGYHPSSHAHKATPASSPAIGFFSEARSETAPENITSDGAPIFRT